MIPQEVLIEETAAIDVLCRRSEYREDGIGEDGRLAEAGAICLGTLSGGGINSLGHISFVRSYIDGT